MIRDVLLPLAVALALGCSGPAATTDAGAATDAAADIDAGPPPATGSVTHLRGVYFVPERRDVSTYRVDEVGWTRIGDTATLAYNLPRMLVGDSQRVSFVGTVTGPSAELTGPHGTASCALDAAGLPASCLEEFVGLTVDLDRVREEALDLDPANVEARVDVAVEFSNDPIGVLEPSDVLIDPATSPTCYADADCGADERCHLELPGTLGLCESALPGTLPAGATCNIDEQCAPPLECDLPPTGTEGVCAASGGG